MSAERAAKNGDLTQLRIEGRDLYERLRSTWERFIEERLFASVVQRLERNVTPGALVRVSYTKQLGEQVHEGWRRCSTAIEAHDKTAAEEALKAHLLSTGEQLVTAILSTDE